MSKKGKLIVLEGGDGSGKGTQVALLGEYCTKSNIPHAIFDFPQYDKSFFGKYIGRFFNGEFGTLKDVSPYVITIPFAADRWTAKQGIEDALAAGKLVIANRYATSNAAYQASRLSERKREEFIAWNFELEYQEFGIPKEDFVLYLSVPPHVSQELVLKKDKRAHLTGNKTKDLYEKERRLVVKVNSIYEEFAKKYPHWITISCVKKDELLSKEEIHANILQELKNRGILI